MHINTVKVFIHYTLSLINQDTLKKNCFCLLIVGSSFLGSSDLFAQDINSFNSSKHRIGFIYGIGNQNLNQWLTADKQKTRDFLSSIGLNPDKIDLGVDYVYQVHFFQLQYYWAFLQRKNWSLDVLIQPQYF